MVTYKKAVFFDRDGTLIETFFSKKKKIPIAIKYIKDLRIVKGAKEVINKLSKKYLILIITNQPDVSRGKNTKQNVIKINSKLKNVLKIDDIFTCYSSDDSNHMRKPKPGMIYLARKKYEIKLEKSYVVGDTYKDILAGQKAKCKTILLKKKYNKSQQYKPDYIIKNLKDILEIIKV